MRSSLLALATLLALGAVPVAAHDGSSHGAPAAATPVAARAAEEERARQYFTDLPVMTQDGRELRFFTDVLKDRVVVLNVFYTECTGMCPLTNQRLSEVQDVLGDEMGRKFWFVSVSLDPETDTPKVLKDYAAKFNAGPGWLFLTGDPRNLKQIVDRLGQAGRPIETHNPLFMLGNVKIARWRKLMPNMPAIAIAEQARLMAEYTEAP